MIINHILGGLGNQMFQYAAARSLALHLNCESFSDLRGFSNYELHNGYELNRVFNVNSKPARDKQIRNVLGWRANPLCMKFLRQPLFESFQGNTFIVEPHFHYWPEFFDITSNSYLHGYWQSEKYFIAAEDLIRKDFTFRMPLEGKNLQLKDSIQTRQSVSIHIRRGDYLNQKKNTKIMNSCSLDYYYDAIKYISNAVDNPSFYIFSDDIDWVKSNFQFEHPTFYVDWNTGLDSYCDMHLMSLCKHNIIANSSFSWWGAWLNQNQDKIVIAPKKWFVNGNKDDDLVPEKWLRL